jgi:uncharacterized protein (TIGR02145 family)
MRATLLTFFTLLTIFLSAQVPALIPYQAIARDASGQPLANSTLNARFTIHEGTASGVVVWQELQTVSTTALGLFTVQLGSSVPLTGVNWSIGNKFMQVELNTGSGFIDIGTQQLLSVPYALYAKQSENGISNITTSGDTLYLISGDFLIIPGISDGNNTSGVSGPHTCGALKVHNPNRTYGTMSDQEGNIYKTIIIGNQEWMAENLNTSTYRNGDAIVTGLSNTSWQNTTDGAWVYFNNDASYACPYGKLYNWYTCVDSRQLCPAGWHVPSDLEWATLTNFLGGSFLAGGKMKSAGNTESDSGLWFSPNDGANNSSGFSGIPGNYRSTNGEFGGNGIGSIGFWWTSTEDGNTISYCRSLDDTNGLANRVSNNNHYGFSVRCLRD